MKRNEKEILKKIVESLNTIKTSLDYKKDLEIIYNVVDNITELIRIDDVKIIVHNEMFELGLYKRKYKEGK